MDVVAFKYIAIGALSIGLAGASYSVAKIFCALLDGIARNPETESKLLKGALIGAGLAEALGLFAFLVMLLLVFTQ